MLCLTDGAHDVFGVGSLGGVERQAVVDERLDATRRALGRRQAVAVKHARHDLCGQRPHIIIDQYLCTRTLFLFVTLFLHSICGTASANFGYGSYA